MAGLYTEVGQTMDTDEYERHTVLGEPFLKNGKNKSWKIKSGLAIFVLLSTILTTVLLAISLLSQRERKCCDIYFDWIYDILPESFQDSGQNFWQTSEKDTTGDGVGDINGTIFT